METAQLTSRKPLGKVVTGKKSFGKNETGKKFVEKRPLGTNSHGKKGKFPRPEKIEFDDSSRTYCSVLFLNPYLTKFG